MWLTLVLVSIPSPVSNAQRLYATTLLGRDCVIKERFKKEYRHPTLDEKITKERLGSVSFLPGRSGGGCSETDPKQPPSPHIARPSSP
jgi:hypothetical protein